MISIIGQQNWQALSICCLEKKDEFFRFIIFSGSTCDEPLIKALKRGCPDVELIDEPDQLPEIKEDEQEKSKEKLIVFDDIINLPKKRLEKIKWWFN